MVVVVVVVAVAIMIRYQHPLVSSDSKKLRLRPPGFEGTGLSRGRQALAGGASEKRRLETD